MDLQTRKIAFVQKFLSISDEKLVRKLEGLLLKNEDISTQNLAIEPMTMDQLNARIDKSTEDADRGLFIEASELKAKIDSWK